MMQDRTSIILEASGPSAEATNDGRNPPENGQINHKSNSRRIAWLQVLGGFCLNANTWGMLGSFGVYQAHYSTKMLQEYSESEISWIGSVQGFFMFLVSFIIGPIFDAGHLHSLLRVGIVCSLLGLFISSICVSYWQLFLTQGVAMGIGFGCQYLPAPALVSMHFKKHQALAMGLSSSGSGIGAVIFPLVFSRLEPHVGFAWASRAVGFILLGTSIIPLVVMRFPKATGPEGAERRALAAEHRTLTKSLARWGQSLVDRRALHDTPFMLLVAGALTTFMGIYVMLYYINLLALRRLEVSPSLASQSLTIVNGASTVGRILPSILADYIGSVQTLAITALLSGMLAFISLSINGTVTLVIWTIAFGSFSGAFMGLPVAGIVSISNTTENIGRRIGMTLGIVGCGILIAEPVAGAILGRRENGWVGLISWSASLMMGGCLFVSVARIIRVGIKPLQKISRAY